MQNFSKLHFIPLIFTVSNIVITIVFNILLSFGLHDINVSGKLRYLQERLKMCYLGQFEFSESSKYRMCVQSLISEMISTANHLYNKYKSNVLINNRQTVKDLHDNVHQYTNIFIELGNNESLLTTSIINNVSDASAEILVNANSMTDQLVSYAKKIMYILAGLMGFVVICQIFYNVNTIIIKKGKQKKHELSVENKAINQMCHELRTSLLPIELYGRELNEYVYMNQNIGTIMINICKCTQEIDYILRRRLDFVKILNNDYNLTLNEVNLVNFIESYIPIFQNYANTINKLCVIESVYDTNLKHYSCNIDTYLMHHIFTNLLKNAVKFSNDGVTNYIKIQLKIKNGYKVRIVVEDSGIGFNKYHYCKDSYGLGLQFVETILKLFNHGDLQFYNKENNNGSIVTVRFELEDKIYIRNDEYCIDHEQRNSVHSSFEDSYNTSINENETYIQFPDDIYSEQTMKDVLVSINVYIIDDSYVVLKCVERVIKKISNNQWTVKTFVNCESFMDYHKDKPFYPTDVFVVDNYMESSGGIMKGVEFVELLREKYSLNNVLIIMSGNEVSCDTRDVIVWGKPLPSDDVIYKTIIDNIPVSHLD